MNSVIACIDGSQSATAVCDAALWASKRLDASLQLLHVLDRSEYPVKGDLTGSIGLGSREHLLDELVLLDEKRSRIALEQGMAMLEAARARVSNADIGEVQLLQRHGRLVESLLDLEESMRLLVIGRQGEAHEKSAHTIGSHLESVIRTVQRPILVALPGFSAPKRFMIAYDGSSTARKALDMVAGSPLLQGLECHVVNVAAQSRQSLSDAELEEACYALRSQGFMVKGKVLEGDIQSALQVYAREQALDLMVMGAYGHSRIRQFFVGSNTSRMLSMSDIALLLLR